MPWQRAKFRDQEVWAEVETAGLPSVNGGRVRIRFSPSPGAKNYPAAVHNVRLDASAPVEELKSEAAEAGSSSPSAVPDSSAPVLYTDGACRGNPGPAGAGVYGEFPDGRRVRVALPLGVGTNNIAELSAIQSALRLLDRIGHESNASVAILTDSTYSIGVLQKGWQAKANRELVLATKELLARRPQATLHKVKGHAGVPGNEEADRLANEAVDGQSYERWQDGERG